MNGTICRIRATINKIKVKQHQITNFTNIWLELGYIFNNVEITVKPLKME